MRCHFCNKKVSESAGRDFGATSTYYDCPVCGIVRLTAKAAEDAGLRLDITAPKPKAPSMTMALEDFIKDYNKNNGKS